MRRLFLLATFLMGQLLFAQGSNPNFEWLHPKPFGASVGWIKVWDANNIYAVGSSGNFMKSTDGGLTFTVNPNAGVPNLSPNPTTQDLRAAYFLNQNLGYLCGYEGVTKTTDGGQTFTEVGPGNFPYTELRAIHFINENTGFVLGSYDDAFAKTTDGGNTWTKFTNLPSEFYYDMKVFSEQRIVLAGDYSGTSNVYVTTNGGASWTTSTAGTNSVFSLGFSDSLNGFAGSDFGTAFKTTDGGLNWTPLTTLNALPDDAFFSTVVQGSNVYFLSYDSTFYFSTNGGTTFTSSQYLPSGRPAVIMRSAAVTGSTVFIAGDMGALYKSTNNGLNWQKLSVNAKYDFIQGLYADQTGKIIAVGSSSTYEIGEQIIVSSNGGNTWTSFSLNDPEDDLRSIKMTDQNTGYAVGSNGSIWKTTDGGFNWSRYSGATTIQAFNGVDFYDAQNGMVVGNDGQAWKTTNAGITWTSITSSIPYDYFNAVDMISPTTALVLGDNVYKTTDGGATWTTISPVFPDSPPARLRMFNESVGVIVGPTGFFGSFPFVFKTTDGGNTWTDMNFSLLTTDKLYDVAFRTADDMVVVGNAGSVYHTSDNGVNWTQFNLGLANFPYGAQTLAVEFSGPNEAIVAGAMSQIVKVYLDDIVPVELASFSCSVNNSDVTLHWITSSELNNHRFEIERKTSQSEVWQKIGTVNGNGTTTNSTEYYFTDENLSPDIYNYRLKQIDFNGSFEYSKVVNADLTSPVAFELMQNYPNPFNPSTTISYNIPNSAFVILKIYDVLGNEITTLVNQHQSAGKYNVSFDAGNLSNGVYIYSLQANDFSDVKKMIYMK